MPLLLLTHVDSQQEVDVMPNTEPGTASCPQWPPLYLPSLPLPLPPDCSQLFHVTVGPPEELSSPPMETWPCMAIAPANLFLLLSVCPAHMSNSVLNGSLLHKFPFALSKVSDGRTHLQARTEAEAAANTSLRQEETEENW